MTFLKNWKVFSQIFLNDFQKSIQFFACCKLLVQTIQRKKELNTNLMSGKMNGQSFFKSTPKNNALILGSIYRRRSII
jgi:hypothetical protein